MTPSLDVAVILPTYDREPLLAEALASIQAQTFAPIEIVVVDDGSTDDSRRVIETLAIPGLTYVYQANRGPAAARNHGLQLVRAGLIAFLDSDDTWLPGKLALQARLLAAHPEVGVVLGRTEGIALDAPAPRLRAFEAFWQSRHFLQLGAALFRRELFDSVGLFDESLRLGEDFDWFVRAEERGVTIHRHDETVLYYRRHRDNLTNDIDRRDRDFLRVLKKSLDRRRAGAPAPGKD